MVGEDVCVVCLAEDQSEAVMSSAPYIPLWVLPESRCRVHLCRAYEARHALWLCAAPVGHGPAGFGSGVGTDQPCWNTAGVSPGLYAVRLILTYSDQSTARPGRKCFWPDEKKIIPKLILGGFYFLLRRPGLGAGSGQYGRQLAGNFIQHPLFGRGRA
jgi:hypothetical protein